MKHRFTPVKIFTAIGILATAALVLSFAAGQGHSDDKDKTKKRKVEKRIEVVEENGQKKVTVTTIENGNKTIQVYTGEQAEAYLNNNGTGSNQSFNMHFDFDTLMGKNSFNFSMNGFGEEFTQDMQQLMEELRSSGSKMQVDIDKMLKSMDTTFSNNHYNYSFNFDQDGENSMKELDSIMKNLDINININGEDMGEKMKEEMSRAKNKSTTHSVMMENLDVKGADKNMGISDISFKPNNNDENYTLRYKSQNMDMTEISLSDEAGKTVYSERISVVGTVLRTVELPQNSGTYVLSLKQGKKKMSRKLTIQ